MHKVASLGITEHFPWVFPEIALVEPAVVRDPLKFLLFHILSYETVSFAILKTHGLND
jgi:hypothetical protein